MVRAKQLQHGQKAKVTITPSRELLAWVVDHVGDGREFASITHAVERGWAILRERQAALADFESNAARIGGPQERSATKASPRRKPSR